MALIMLCGQPTSGKTHRARQLVSSFSHALADSPSPIRHITHISEHSLALPRRSFTSAAAEKQARAAIYSATKRALAKDTVVVLDGGNYIKGWRYQLYCEAKNAGLRSCVVFVGATEEERRAANASRRGEEDGAREEDPYAEQTWTELGMRFEEPNDMARWDRPLYAVVWADADLGAQVGARIWAEVVLGVGRDGKELERVRPNAATVLPRAGRGDQLHELDRATQAVLSRVVEGSREEEEGAEVAVGEGLVVRMPARKVGFAELQRLRRQFVAMQRAQMVEGRVEGLFVDWLNERFE